MHSRNLFFTLILWLFASIIIISPYSIAIGTTSEGINDFTNLDTIKTNQEFESAFQGNSNGIALDSIETSFLAATSDSTLVSRHVMCKGHTSLYEPLEPTPIFRPSDAKAVCLTTVSINDTIEFRWFYRSNSSMNWESCYNWSDIALIPGEHYFAGYLLIAGYWPSMNHPKAYKVEVYLDGYHAFSEFFEVTNGGLNSPRICETVDGSGQPVNMKSEFIIGDDLRAHHYLRFDRIAYYNEELRVCHNFTTNWIQPNGSIHRAYSGSFTDYKAQNVSRNFWEYGYTPSDYITINSSTPIGNWKVEVYLDKYYSNDTWAWYGPVATTPFMIRNESVADWTFMVYLDGDNSLEAAGIEVFPKMASVEHSSAINVVVQMDRVSGDDARYGDWTDCKRFYITENIVPRPENATLEIGEVNMGHPDTLRDFVNWTLTYYPAKYYALVIWDHGIGCLGVSFDITSLGDSLSLPELSQALTGFPVIMDVLLIDACSMSMVEVAYQVRDCANILVGPEGLGYAPAPYNLYLSTLISTPTMDPRSFAGEIATNYMLWCRSISEITNATIAATDLTKITALIASIDDLAQKSEDQLTPHLSSLLSSHEQIIIARNLTERYSGPYDIDTSYYIDLYDLAQRIFQHVDDEQIQQAATQVMTALEDTIIIEEDKNRPDSHGLAIFFPDNSTKYEKYDLEYNQIELVKDSLWDEFIENYVSGNVLTVETILPYIEIGIDEKIFLTDQNGITRIFVQSGSYTINISRVSTNGPGSRAVFIQWSDNDTSTSRTFLVEEKTTLEVVYESQYRLIMNTNYGITNPAIGEHWYPVNSTFEIDATPPSQVLGERYVWIEWNGTGDGSYSSVNESAFITMREPINETARWRHEYYLLISSLHGSPLPETGWFEAGKLINVSLTSPVMGSTGTRYVCVGWNATGSVSGIGETTHVNLTMTQPTNLTWNWKTQFLLSVSEDPLGTDFQPEIQPEGPWYDNGTLVNCTAPNKNGYSFDHWTVDNYDWGSEFRKITILMDSPHDATIYYVRPPVWWEYLGSLPVILGIMGVAITIALVGIIRVIYKGKKAVKAVEPTEIKVSDFLPGRVTTGFEDLDRVLLGGIPENYAVILTSSSCDERDSLIKSFLESGAKAGEITFHLTVNPSETTMLAEKYESNFFLFICNPRADRIIQDLPNVFKLKGIENLTEISIALAKGFDKAGVKSSSKRICVEIVSDVLLQHKAIRTRRWLTDLITELKSRGFTLLGVIDPQMHSAQDVHAILDLFDGEIAIYEREVGARHLKIKRMHNKKYLDCEMLLKRERLGSTKEE